MRLARVPSVLLPGPSLHRWSLIPLALLTALSGCGGDGPSKPVAVSVEPTTANVHVGQTQQFAATVTGTTNQAVTWAVDGGATSGTITASGLYVAPAAVPNPPTVTVRATSQADPNKSGTATVTVTPVPVIAVNVSPPTATVEVNQTQQFTAEVTGATNQAVTWTVDGGATNGTITVSGLYTAPVGIPNPATVIVRATNHLDLAKAGTASVTVAQAASSQLSGHVVFSMRTPGGGPETLEIYRQRANGTGFARLTTNSVADCHPRWSPNGTGIAFLRSADGDLGLDLYHMSEDGVWTRQLTFNGPIADCGDDNSFRWSPLGTRLLVAEQGPHGLSWVLHALDGSAPDTLFAANDTAGADFFGGVDPWAPDGSAVVYHKYFGSNPGVYVCTLSPRSHRLVVAGGGDPFWSLDGTRLYFEKQAQELWSVSVAGTDAHACGTVGDFLLPSPQRSQLVYQNHAQNQQLFLLDLGSCAARALWPTLQDRPEYAEPVQWSRDGRYLLYRDYYEPTHERVRAVEVATQRVFVVFDEAAGMVPDGFVDWKP